ncbi:MAG TPA: 2OG-Fe(II) oxygenase [Allosphingosinicella sp.]|nr:2OG-Fe(II) oxygenase [Allosphingosinicella sp.]
MNELDYRVTLRAWIGDRLERNPKALRIPSSYLDIFIVRDVLDERDCAELIALIDSVREPSKLLSPHEDPEFRTSESSNFHPDDEAVIRAEGKITDLMGIDPAQGETIQGQRYAIGQQFKPHFDFFHEGEPYWEEMATSGGQRTWTAMVFLNDVEGGGETFFERAAVKITPRRGNLLTWNNMNADGHPNEYAIHQGLPVTAGTKYIITKWYRERTWVWTDVPSY